MPSAGPQPVWRVSLYLYSSFLCLEINVDTQKERPCFRIVVPVVDTGSQTTQVHFRIHTCIVGHRKQILSRQVNAGAIEESPSLNVKGIAQGSIFQTEERAV